MQKCIVVLGMHRSGTSVLMGVLSMLGVELGLNLMAPTEGNPRGYFENQSICELNDEILEKLNASWDNIFWLQKEWLNHEYVIRAKIKARELIEREFRGNNIIGIKDPRICILFPFWSNIFEELNINPFYVISVRNPFEVAASLQRREGVSIQKGIILWMNYMMYAEHYTRSFSRVFSSFDRLISNVEESIDHIMKGLNIDFLKEYEDVIIKVKRFIHSGLRHHECRGIERNNPLMDLVYEYYLQLERASHGDDLDKGSLHRLDLIRNQFFDIQAYFYNEELERELRGITSDEARINAQSLRTLRASR